MLRFFRNLNPTRQRENTLRHFTDLRDSFLVDASGDDICEQITEPFRCVVNGNSENALVGQRYFRMESVAFSGQGPSRLPGPGLHPGKW